MKLQEMAPIKCRCSGGSILLVHFSGKVLDLNVRGCCMSKKAGRAGDFRRGPLSIALRFAKLLQPAAYFAS